MLITKSDDARILKEFKPVRLEFFVDKKGGFHAEEVVAFDCRIFNPTGIECESAGGHKIPRKIVEAPRGLWHLDDLTPAQFEAYCEALGVYDGTEKKGDYKEQSRRRSIKRLRGYVLGTQDLNLFVTLTLSPEKVDRTNYGEAVDRVGRWLDNRVRRKGLKYVLVPELHEAGGIHFHGFFNSAAVKREKSGLKRDIHAKKGEYKNFRPEVEPNRKGKIVYNLPEFDIGFTTAIRLGLKWEDRKRAVEYCLKYMEKGADKVGGRWYLHGGDLGGAKYAYFDYGEAGRWAETFEGLQGAEFNITDRLRCKVLTGPVLDKICMNMQILA